MSHPSQDSDALNGSVQCLKVVLAEEAGEMGLSKYDVNDGTEFSKNISLFLPICFSEGITITQDAG